MKDPTFKQGIGIREDFDLWEWHFRMIILSGMKKIWTGVINKGVRGTG